MINIYSKNSFNRIPDCVLFDTDNTLYPYEPAHQAGVAEIQKKIVNNFSISDKEFIAAFKEARNEVKNQTGKTAASHNRLLYMQKMLEILGLGSQIFLALDLEQSYWNSFLLNAKLFNYVTEFLDDLRISKIPTVIVTDLTAQIQFRKMIYFGLDHSFDYIVTSEEAGADKPNPAPFQLALKKVNPAGNNIWMIGDSFENDIIGSKDAINAITLQKIHHGVSEGFDKKYLDCSFDNFNELRKLFKSLRNE